uniref:carcinoembryonic antigen-related cell adhesion molecule 1-like n=1 Tax=Euleptes europaea TaxID=460621 RepID=UPI002541D526|nr:carcinoembryonic antigen-related cell adhesion molecule 1-like [Euleptes europaea]
MGRRRAEGPRPAGGSPGRRRSWHAALLAAAILSSGFLLTQAQDIPVTPNPSWPVEGQDVTLTPGGVSNFILCSWFRGVNAEANRIFTCSPSSPDPQNGPGFIGRETAGPNCSLHIRNLMLNDTGIYIVSKFASGGFTTGQVHIEVSERVSNVTIISHPTKAIESQFTMLSCSAEGTNVSYIWSKGNQILQSSGHISVSNSSLTFSSTSRNDTGNYTCYGHNSFSNSSTTYLLDVFYGPDVPVISPQQHHYAEGSNLTLRCYADSHPPPQYTWYFNEVERPEKSPQLSITSLSFDEAGNYSCNASNTETVLSNYTSLEIKVLEEVFNVSIEGRSETTENGSVTLSCSSKGSEVSYTWFKESLTLEDGGHISLQGPNHENLTLSPVRRSDAGSYTCRGINNVSEDTSNPFLLNVFYGPDDPIISPPKHYYVEGSNLNLTCRADSNPVAQYTWFFNETKEVGNGNVLLIPDLSFDESGNYTCNATNDMTNIPSAAMWEIQVLEKLSPPILWPTDLSVKEHTNVTLNCNTSEHSSVNISWFKDGKPIPVLSEQIRVLTFPDISKDDEGTYTCEAGNRANSAKSNPSKIAVDSPFVDPGLSAGAIVGIVIGCLVGVVLIVAVLYFVLKKTTLGRMEQHSSNGNIPSAPGQNQGVTDTKPMAGEEDIQYTTLAFNSNSPSQPSLGPTVPLESSTIYSVIKKK